MNHVNPKEKSNDIVSIDCGTAWVKACKNDIQSVRFPSLYAYRQPTKWENYKDKRIVGIGEDALDMAKYPNSVVIHPITRGIPVNPSAFQSIVQESIKRLNATSLGQVIIGLPYAASNQRNSLRDMIQKTLGCDCYVVPQALGILYHNKLEDQNTICISLGHGTVELVAFSNGKVLTGQSLTQGVNYLFKNGLDYLKVNSPQKIEKILIDGLADTVVDAIKGIESTLKEEFEIVVAGGGCLVNDGALYLGIQKRISDKGLLLSKDPSMAVCLGMWEYLSQKLSDSTRQTQSIQAP